MRKIILTMQMSLDGVVTDVDKWMTLSDEILEDSLKYYDSLDAMLIGGDSYQGLAEYWQQAETSSDSELERKFAKRINNIKKYVISRKKRDLVWNNTEQLMIKDEASLKQEIEKLKKGGTKNISVESGARSWQLFIQNKLFDELWVFVHPVVAGAGGKLFDDVSFKLPMQLINGKVYKNGVIGMHYQNRGE